MERSGRTLARVVAVIVRVLMALAAFGVVVLMVGGAILLFAFDYEAKMASEFGSDVPPRQAALIVIASAAALLAAVAAMLHRLRRVMGTVQSGEPFHPRNPSDLRVIALLLVLTEIGSTLLAFATPRQWGGGEAWSDVDLTSWFAALIILVLAEVFREGARLRADAELTV